MRKKECLRPYFAMEDNSRESSEQEQLAERRARNVYDRLYRFAEITAEGTYDAKCTLHYDPAKPASQREDEEIICLDRWSDLDVLRVVLVHDRSPATEGSFHAYEGHDIHRLNAVDTANLIQAYREVLRAWDLDDEDVNAASYAAFSDPEYKDEAILCECEIDSCERHWPSKSGHLRAESLADPYSCSTAKRTKDYWMFIDKIGR